MLAEALELCVAITEHLAVTGILLCKLGVVVDRGLAGGMTLLAATYLKAKFR